MTLNELDEKLNKFTNDFSVQMHMTYSESSSEPVTESDLHELSRQVFYTFDRFRESIIEYLKSNQ